MTRATTPSTHVFLNFSSGSAKKQEELEKLKKAMPDAVVEGFEAGTDLSALAEAAVREGASLLAAGGGDGTVRAVAAAAVRTGATLGVLPAGTLNHFARDLGMPLDIEQAAEVIARGRTEAVDVGEVNGHIFVNNSVIGLYPAYRGLRSYFERKGWSKRVAILWGLVSAMRRFPFLKLHIQVEGREVVRRTPYVLIANNEHGMEGYHLGLRTTLNAGLLWVYVMRPTSRLGLLGMLLRILLGRFRGADEFEIFPVREVTIEARQKRLGVALDGEVTLIETPLHYRSLPGALRVVVPETV